MPLASLPLSGFNKVCCTASDGECFDNFDCAEPSALLDLETHGRRDGWPIGTVSIGIQLAKVLGVDLPEWARGECCGGLP